MDIENTIDYWMNIKSVEEAKAKVMTGDMEESTKKDLEILKGLDIQKTDSVLDFGCGIGRLTKPISHLCKEIIGADISEKLIGYASKYCDNENTLFKPLNNEEGDGLPLNTFDKAYSIIVIQHIEKNKSFRALYNICKSLKMNGKMLIQFPSLEKNEKMYKNYMLFKQDFGSLQPRMEFYTVKELDFIFELLRMEYKTFEGETDYYVLATKKEEINMQRYYAKVKWK